MTREALADRLVNYADAAAAFSLVNSLAFLLTLTESEVRCSLIHLEWLVVTGQVAHGLLITAVILGLRRFELRVRASTSALQPDVARYLRGFFVTRLVVVWLASLFTVAFGSMALSDSTCIGP